MGKLYIEFSEKGINNLCKEFVCEDEKILVIPAKAQISAQPLSKGLFHDSFQRDFHRQASPPRNIIVIT